MPDITASVPIAFADTFVFAIVITLSAPSSLHTGIRFALPFFQRV